MYTCVNCLTPSSSLYHELRSSSTTSSSISSGNSQRENRKPSRWIVKLTRCKHCQHDVDHYIEHEVLLIGIDLVLLRLPAYRHLFFNRSPFASFCVHEYFENNDKLKDSEGDMATNTKQEEKQGDTKKAFIYLFVAAFLDAYHKFEALQIGSSHDDVTNYLLGNISMRMGMEKNHQGSVPPVLILHLMITSFVEHILFFLGVALSSYYISTRMLNEHQMNHTRKQNDNDEYIYLPDMLLISKLFLAIVLPSTFRFISIFLLIWENSHVVRILASFFVLLFQFISIHTILARTYFLLDYDSYNGEIKYSRQGHKNNFILERLMPGIYPLLCGMILRTLITFILHNLYYAYSIPFIFQCSGYGVDIPHFSNYVGGWTLLCIT